MTKIVYFNGAFSEPSEVAIRPNDGGWLHGAGLFETMRAENGRVFRLAAHLRRLRRSAEQLLRPINDGELPSEATIHELLERNGLTSARLRLTVSAGTVGESHENASSALTVCLTAGPLAPYPAQAYEKGIGVVICPHRQSTTDPTMGHKTTSYFPRILGLREARQARCNEAIWFTDDKRLAEGSISNVFVVRKGTLKTPPLDTPVLPGIARSVVLELAGQCDCPHEETVLTIDDLLDADEVFLTNTLMQVMPVVRVEKRDIGEGRVGPVTKKLGEAYRETVRKECGAS